MGFCYLAKPVIIPFILALYLSLILSPLVNFATSQLKIPRTVSSILVVLLVLAILLAGLYFLVGQAQSFMKDFPKYAYKLRTLLGSLQKEVKQIQEKTEVLTPEEKSIPEVKISSTWTNYLANLGTVFEMVSTLVLVLFFVLFLLKDQDIFKKKLISIASRTHRKLTLNILDDISQNIQQYLVTMSLINLALVGIHTVSFFLQGIPYFYIWGLLVGLLNFIPYVGPFIALIPPTLMAIIQYEGWGRPLLLVAIYAFIQTLEGNYITPSLVGRQVDLNPIAILLSAIFWTWLWGPVGLLLSTPLLVSLKVVLDRFENLRPVAIFLGESVEEPEGSS